MWVVRKGQAVHHNGQEYKAGQAVPCSDEEAAAMPHAVENTTPATAPAPAPVPEPAPEPVAAPVVEKAAVLDEIEVVDAAPVAEELPVQSAPVKGGKRSK